MEEEDFFKIIEDINGANANFNNILANIDELLNLLQNNLSEEEEEKARLFIKQRINEEL